MEIKINIDESKFQEVLEKELGAFTQEELHEILRIAIAEYLRRDEILKEYMSKPDVDRWGSAIRGSSVLEKLVSTVDLNDVFQEPKEKIKELISTDEALKSAANEILINVFKSRFRSAFTEDWDFMNSLANRVSDVLAQRSQRN